MSSETFDAVMRSIKDGMTGDSKADMAYLMKVAEEYKDHELGKEILRECGRMAYDIAPDDFHEQLERKIAEDQAEWDERKRRRGMRFDTAPSGEALEAGGIWLGHR